MHQYSIMQMWILYRELSCGGRDAITEYVEERRKGKIGGWFIEAATSRGSEASFPRKHFDVYKLPSVTPYD